MPCLVVLALATAGCGAYISGYRYEPAVDGLDIDVPGTAATPDARVLVRVVGVRRELPEAYASAHASKGVDAKGGDAKKRRKTRGLDLMVRIDNLGDTPVFFDASGVSVVTGDLRELEPALLAPGEIEVPAGSAEVIALTFALPPEVRGPEDVGDLTLRVGVTIEGEVVSGGLAFAQRRTVTRTRRKIIVTPYGFPRYSRVGAGLIVH